MKTLLSFATPITLMGALLGCSTPDVSHRFDENNKTLDACHGSCEREDGYLIADIEFDDQGFYHDIRQRNEVFAWIKKNTHYEDSKEDGKENEGGKDHAGAIIVSYTHGWKHNAKDIEDGNRQEFQKVLKGLVNNERILTDAINKDKEKEDHEKPRIIIGVYTGWRGESINTRWVETLSFWERKKTAQLIGTRDAKDYFTALSALKNSIGKNNENPAIKDDSRLVIVGHSFGGLLVHSATTGLMLDRFNQSVENASLGDLDRSNQSIESASEDDISSGLVGLGDLVVLINPAFEALDIATLLNAADQHKYGSKQRPFFMILASKTDEATNWPFRVGRFFSTFFDNYQKPLIINGTQHKRREADNKVIGHYKPFWTHQLKTTKPDKGDELTPTITVGPTKLQSTGFDKDSPFYPPLCSMWNEWKTDSNTTTVEIPAKDSSLDPEVFFLEQYSHDGMELRNKHNPFMVISVDGDIHSGHGIKSAESDVEETSKLLPFIAQMVMFQTAPINALEDCPPPSLKGTVDGLTKKLLNTNPTE